MDIQLLKDGVFKIPIKKGWNSMIYPYQGVVQYTAEGVNHEVKQNHCCLL